MKRSDAIEAVQRMQDYILSHITEPITLKQLAYSANYSPWHCAKLFRELVGKTPFDYIRAIRLSKAALLLRDEKPKVLDIALDFVFDSHEGFTRAFSKQFGISPKAYAKLTPAIPLFMPYRIGHHPDIHKGESYMKENCNANTVFVQVMERPARKLILKRGIKATEYYEYCEEVGCDVWGVLSSVKEALYEPIGMWLPKSMKTCGTSEYVQGVEVPLDYNKPIPDGFELIHLPPCKMMVFQGQPYDDENFEDAIGSMWQLIDHYNPALYGYEWAYDEAPKFQLAPMGYRGYIEARPVRQVNTNS